MAVPKKSRKSKGRGAELVGQTDPRAALDSAALLAVAKPLLQRLEADLIARAQASPAVTGALTARFEAEKAASRTADSFAGWSAALATQVAAAWLLSCVFVRTLEDRGLLKQARLAGPGAEDSQRQFFQLAPSLTERDYLLTVFRELAHHPAAKDLFAAEHSLVWKLSPSAEVAKELLALFRAPTASEPAFRFGQASTRFLGDLYQDLSEDVRKRFALLQTPDFVETYILDRTLEPAIARFGLDDTTLIDPTCGSGHFLLGAFDRLFEHRLRAAPGIDPRTAAVQALDGVYGADINPFAIAIARFRLTLAFLDKAGYAKLADAPALPLHLVVADSLRINPQHPQQELWQHAGAGASAAWLGDVFAFDDERAAKDVLGRQYAAVVANPPYITVKDAALREVYRAMYVSAAGKYALSAPFCERIFQLARPRGYTGQITANSFMKREFGKRLIEEYLPTVNLESILNTSGAYIPGHGTPTVLLFGTKEGRQGSDVLAVLAKRGEPSTPDEPSQGRVWRSIVEHGDEVGFEDNFLSVARVSRDALAKHPWSLGGGGASELKELLEGRAGLRLEALVDEVGFASFTGLDDAFILPRHSARTLRLEDELLRPMVIGECVRDWFMSPEEVVLTPYDKATHVPLPYAADTRWGRFLWRYRTVAKNVTTFGGRTREDDGQNWWEWYRWQRERYLAQFRITFAFVATHNHFVLDRGGNVFNRSAPIIKLPERATADDHVALLAYLNSSTACFWMKQVAQAKASHTEERPETFTPGMIRYEFTSAGLLPLPLPNSLAGLLELARRAEACVAERSRWAANAFVEKLLVGAPVDSVEFERRWSEQTNRLIAAQEDIDWAVYGLFGLTPAGASRSAGRVDAWSLLHTDRLFLNQKVPTSADPGVWDARVSSFAAEPFVQLIESAEFKRRWDAGRGSFGQKSRTYSEQCAEAVAHALLDQIEVVTASAASTWCVRDVESSVNQAGVNFLGVAGLGVGLPALVEQTAVPFLAAIRLNEAGLAVAAEWVKCWESQRIEDNSGESMNPPVPPIFTPKHFHEKRVFDMRGKLDVPKERFVSYPYCESDQDGEPVYGWAGWDHLQRAQALASLYLKRKDGEGWAAARLTPMLAGLLELIPWVKQWHNEPSTEFDGLRMGDYFEKFLDGECRQHGLTHDDLRAWRPPTKTRGKTKGTKAAKSAATEPPADGDEIAAAPKPKKPRAKKQQQATAAVPPVTTEAE